MVYNKVHPTVSCVFNALSAADDILWEIVEPFEGGAWPEELGRGCVDLRGFSQFRLGLNISVSCVEKLLQAPTTYRALCQVFAPCRTRHP